MRTIFCHNSQHLGDCLQSIHFLIKSSQINDVTFEFNCNENYFEELRFLIRNHKINILKEKENESIDLWIDSFNKHKNYQEHANLECKAKDQAKTFLLHWQDVSKLINIKCPFVKKENLIYDEEVLNENCSHEEHYDYLIINSRPLSGQCHIYSEEKFKNLANKLIENHKVITTQKIENIPCTTDYDLNVIEIGKLSKNVKNIIAVNTGPLHLCMNKWTVEKINFKIIVATTNYGCTSETFEYGSNFETLFQIPE